VRPAWLDAGDDPPRPGEVVVRLDPSRAFGSGSHPSTLACLAAVDRFAETGSAVLDVGCGSGVLAVAAARLGASPVVAVDVDPVAVAATASNAAANDVRVDARHGSVDAVEGTFDLVLANIGAGTTLALAAGLAARVAPGGRLVVAGLYEDRADEVAAELVEHGLAEVERRVDEGWACLIHQTPPAIEHTVRRRHVGAARDEGAR
jgi:ribosomal protein L11 methyltransferase